MKTCVESQTTLESVLEDYLVRLDSGEAPDEKEYLDRFPDLSDPLTEFFRNFRLLDEACDSGWPTFHGNRFESFKLPTSPSGERPLPKLGGFRLIKRLGEGSQGVVYEAEQLSTKRLVALKVIRYGALASDAERRRFEAEVELASRLDHPNIATVYERGTEGGWDYFAMQFVRGKPLGTYVSGERLDIKTTVRLFLQICEAVSYAHQHCVIHRDLKPTNILVDNEGHAFVLDFGLAKPTLEGEACDLEASQVGDFNGNWSYASPEQALRDPARVGILSDVYALGVILFELLTDELPYPVQCQTPDVAARHIVQTRAQRPTALRREIGKDLEAVLLRCLEKNPQDRYQSAAELGEDLRRYADDQPVYARKANALYLLGRVVRQYRWRAISIAVLSVAFIGLVSVMLTLRATADVKSILQRDSMRLRADSLDVDTREDNVLQRVRQRYPDLPEIQRFARPALADTASLLADLIADQPEHILTTIAENDEPAKQAAEQWLDEREPALDRFMELISRQRLAFQVELPEIEGLLFEQRPSNDTYDAFRLCEAFAARALRASTDGDHKKAVASLETARSIALDLADTRLLQQKDLMIPALDAAYEAALLIFSDSSVREDQTAMSAYETWASSDPVVVDFRRALEVERMAARELIEDSSGGRMSDGKGFINIDVFDSHLGGALREGKFLNEAMRRIARQTTPCEALSLVENYFQEIALWDELQADEIIPRAEELESRLENGYPAWSFIKFAVPRCARMFVNKARLEYKREELLAVAHSLSSLAREP